MRGLEPKKIIVTIRIIVIIQEVVVIRTILMTKILGL